MSSFGDPLTRMTGNMDRAACVKCGKHFRVNDMVPYGPGDLWCNSCHLIRRSESERKLAEEQALATIEAAGTGFKHTIIIQLMEIPDAPKTGVVYQTIVAPPMLIGYQELIALGAKQKGINVKFQIVKPQAKK